MRLARSPTLRLFRTLIVGMLVLAIVAKPLLAELCNVHELTHLVASAHVDTPEEARSDREHANGAHAFIHAFDAPAAQVDPFPVIAVPPVRFAHVVPLEVVALAPPVRPFESPFRPPIA